MLIQNIKEILLPSPVSSLPMLTRQRHIQALKNIKELLTNALHVCLPEIVAFELNTALDTIGELTGKVMRKEVLDKIFDEFCIGK